MDGDAIRGEDDVARFWREGDRLYWGTNRAAIQVATFVALPSGKHDTDFEDRMIHSLNFAPVVSEDEPRLRLQP